MAETTVRHLAERFQAQLRGYVGVDLVLGPAEDGSRDVVLEVNPRLTTSYVGLSCLAKGNLAAEMLAAAEGKCVEPAFADRLVQYDTQGNVEVPSDGSRMFFSR